MRLAPRVSHAGGGPAAFDQLERSIHFIGPIDDQIQALHLVEFHQGQAELCRQRVGGQAGGYTHDVQAFLVMTSSEFNDGVVHG